MQLNVTEIEILPDGRLNLKNAAKYIGIKPTTLRVLIQKKRAPKYIKPGHIFFYKTDIDEWLNSTKSE